MVLGGNEALLQKIKDEGADVPSLPLGNAAVRHWGLGYEGCGISTGDD